MHTARLSHCLAVIVLLAAAAGTPAAEIRRLQSSDTGAALANPGMGWMLHFYSSLIVSHTSQSFIIFSSVSRASRVGVYSCERIP